MVHRPEGIEHKLSDVWWMVLLRGLVEVGFLIPLVFALKDPLPLIRMSVVLIGLGGLLEIGMVVAMRGHFFQGILRFIGGASVALAVFLFFYSGDTTTLVFLLVMSGLWLVVRGFGVFWLGLSIVERPLDRAVPALGGLITMGMGMWAMFEGKTPGDYAWLMGIYAIGSAPIHLFVAYRLWRDRKRPAGVDESVEEIEHEEQADE